MKYSLEFKLECVNKYKNGEYIRKPDNCKCEQREFMRKIREWNDLYDNFGIDGLKHKTFNKDWTKEDRFRIIAQVLGGKTTRQVAAENGVAHGIIFQWLRRYREKGIDGLELHKGRKPKVPTMPKKKTTLAPSEKEELELLRARNEYLEAENLYLKKLDALVSQREAAHPKAKKQKSSKK